MAAVEQVPHQHQQEHDKDLGDDGLGGIQHIRSLLWVDWGNTPLHFNIGPRASQVHMLREKGGFLPKAKQKPPAEIRRGQGSIWDQSEV